MSLIVTLSPEVETLIRARVEREEDMAAEVNSLLQMAIEQEEEIEKAVAAGEADFAAGRFSSGDAVWTRFEAKYGTFPQNAPYLQSHVKDLERTA